MLEADTCRGECFPELLAAGLGEVVVPQRPHREPVGGEDVVAQQLSGGRRGHVEQEPRCRCIAS